jgi:RNA polymerase-associated protein
MSVAANKRSAMTLYSGRDDVHSHRARIVLAEKGVSVDVVEIEGSNYPDDFLELNPYGMLPTLLDRDLVLYHSRIIMEYLDERFPHPPLLPVYPVMRAKARLLMHRIEKDWYTLIPLIKSEDKAISEEAKKQLREGILALAPLFGRSNYFIENEFTLVDCSLAPLLWRLPHYDIKLPNAKTKVLDAYTDRLFSREAFQASLTEYEREIRE